MQADTPLTKAPVTDLTVYGATSFVARHVLTYLVQYQVLQSAQVGETKSPPLKLTVAGRNAEKLRALQAEWTKKMKLLAEATHLDDETVANCFMIDVFTADSDDVDGLRKMAARTKVILNCAGPFAHYGTNVVAACAEFGTDYVDITGEMSWVGDMRERFQAQAQKSSARIVSLCGYDSMPSDLSVFAAVQALREVKKKNGGGRTVNNVVDIGSATTYFSALGMANGGTLQTMQDYPVDWAKCLKQPVPFMMEDPLVLCDPTLRQDTSVETTELRKRWAKNEWINQLPFFHSFLKGGFSAPHMMAVVNAKCVYASSIALQYGSNFSYFERMLPVGFRMTRQLQTFSVIPALLTHAFLLLCVLVLRLPLIGPILLDWLGGPGTGASDAMCSGGYVEIYTEVRGPVDRKTGKVDKANVFLKFKGDPGNWTTAQCVAEAALCLLYDRKVLPKHAGFGTPAQVMGDALLQRLRKSPVRKVEFVSSVRLQTAQVEWKMFP